MGEAILRPEFNRLLQLSDRCGVVARVVQRNALVDKCIRLLARPIAMRQEDLNVLFEFGRNARPLLGNHQQTHRAPSVARGQQQTGMQRVPADVARRNFIVSAPEFWVVCYQLINVERGHASRLAFGRFGYHPIIFQPALDSGKFT